VKKNSESSSSENRILTSRGNVMVVAQGWMKRRNERCRSVGNNGAWKQHPVPSLLRTRQSSIYTATTRTSSTTRRAFSLIHKTKRPAWNATRIRSCCEQTLRVCDIMR